MNDQKPSVGRIVHFHGTPPGWEYSMPLPEDKEWACEFRGPFAATIVRVNPDGTVNLRVDYPSMLIGTDRHSELVLNVPFRSGAPLPFWEWPPRV